MQGEAAAKNKRKHTKPSRRNQSRREKMSEKAVCSSERQSKRERKKTQIIKVRNYREQHFCHYRNARNP